jgi:hypothetical protein
MKMLAYLALPIVAAIAAPAAAVTYTATGTTAGGPTFNRPLSGTPPTSLSGVGTAVSYDVFGFTVGTSGTYSLTTDTGFDSFLVLYMGAFDPSSPLANAIGANDDSAQAAVGDAFLSLGLTAGTSYYAVVTAFENGVQGAYTLTIDGPGTIAPIGGAVPEPATWAMMLAGVGMIGGGMRYRRRRTTLAYS